MSIVVRDSGDIYFDGTHNVSVMSIFVDSAADLSGLVQYEGIYFQLGSDALDVSTGNKYRMKTDGTWVLQPDNMWQNVYTKTEVDSIVQDINADITTAESDIAVLHDATERLIDTGAKNLCDTATGTGTRFVNIPIILQPGVYHVYFGGISSSDTDAQTCQFAAFASDNTDASNYLQLQRINGVNGVLTVTAITSYVRLYASSNYGSGAGDTVTFTDMMICTESDWEISQKYVPYCPTLYELYQMVRSYHP